MSVGRLRVMAWLLLAACKGGAVRTNPGEGVSDLRIPSAPSALSEGSQGLAFRLSEGSAEGSGYSRPPLAAVTTLSASETDALLARLPALEVAERQDFAMRPGSPPPPRKGEEVRLSFPPPPDVGPPPVATGPLQVLRSLPVGEVPLAAQVSLTFNQPMVPLTTQDAAAAKVPVRLEPQPEGSWRWVGTQTLLFEPPVRMPMATSYALSVPAGTVSANGGRLEKGWATTFTTPALRLTGQVPAGSSVSTMPVIVARFDQRVDPAALARHLVVRAGDRPVEVRLATADEVAADSIAQAAVRGALEGTWVALRPLEPLPTATDVRVEIPVGAPSAEGPLRTTSAQSFGFSTYGPLTLVDARCGWDERCRPTDAFELRFSNQLRPESLQVTVQPELSGAQIQAWGNTVSISGLKQPQTRYTVTVAGSLTDEFAQTLTGPVVSTFDISEAEPAWPYIDLLGPEPQIADPFFAPEVAFSVVGLSRVRVRVSLVQPRQWTEWTDYGRGQYDDERKGLPGRSVLDEVRTLPGDMNLPQVTTIDLKPFLEGGLGHVVVEVSSPAGTARDRRVLRRGWVSSTRIGLVHLVDGQDLLVWATDLTTGRPLADVSVAFASGEVIGRTDKDGLLRMARPPDDSDGVEALVASLGADTAVLSPSGGAWRVSQWGPSERGQEVAWFTFDDRHLYRPGEVMHLKGWVRTVDFGRGGDTLPPGARRGPVKWSAWDAQNVEIGRGELALDAWSGFSLDLQLPGTPNLGSARVELSLGGDEHYAWFDIQEFRRPEFETSAVVETEGPHLIGGSAVAAVTASYYAGGALPGAEARWDVTATAAEYKPPGWDEWRFGRWRPWWRWWHDPDEDLSTSQSLTGATDAMGTHRVRVDLDAVAPARPMSVHAQATVYDVNRQAWASSADFLVHPSEVYVGARPKRSFFDADQPVDVELVVVDLDGRPVAAVIEAQLVRREWRPFLGGEWQEVDAEVLGCTMRADAAPVTCRWEPEETGSYELRARVVDAQGRPNETRFPIWVGAADQPLVQAVEQEKVLLVPDQEQYAVGDSAKILLQAPFHPSEAVVTWLRSGIIHTETLHIDGPSTTLTVPIEEAHIPGLSVHVELVGTATRTDLTGRALAGAPPRPAFGSGEVKLKVPPLLRTLAVSVRPADKALAPGGSTTVEVEVRSAAGRPVSGASVALVVADESVLALGGWQVADPVSVFYPDREPGMQSGVTRGWIRLATLAAVEASAEVQLQGGAGRGGGGAPKMAMRSAPSEGDMMMMESGAMPPPSPMAEAKPESESEPGTPIAVRSDFSATALWVPATRTGSDGRVIVDLKLPDNLTRYRVTAVVVDEGISFGKGESTVTARLPLMLRPSAPRFLNFGDRAELPFVIQNQTDAPLSVKLAVRADNLTVDGGRRGGRKLVVPANDRVEVRFPVAAEMAGMAHVQAAISAGSFADAADVVLPVWTPATSEAFATYGVLDGPTGTVAMRQPVEVPDTVWPQFGGLEIHTSSTALQSLTDAFIYLVEYPYGCVEQISSRVLSVAALRDVLQAFGAEGLPAPEALEAMVKADLLELARRQNGDGSWGWWRQGERYPSPVNTLHATHALLRAREAGFEVPEAALQRGLRRLDHIEALFRDEWSKEARWALRAQAIAIRTVAGQKVGKDARALYAEAGPAGLSIESLGWILPALKADGASAEAAAILLQFNNRVTESASSARFVTSYGEEADALILASSRRTDAVILDALLQVAPADPLLPKVVAGLLDGRNKGRWGSTQENAWVLLALDRYFKVAEAVTPDMVAKAWLGAGLAGEHAFRGRTTERASIEVPMSWLVEAPTQELVLAREGAGRLYYRLGLRYAPKDLDLEAAERGMSVTRTYEAVDDPGDVRRGTDGSWVIRAGARVKVTLRMVAPDRRYHVALVDPLPAGLEILNPALNGVGELPDEPASEEDWTRGWWWGPWYEHENLRDERAEAFAQTVWPGVYSYRYFARATTPGHFVVPPAKAEEMYHAETFGRTATDRVVVE